MNWLLFQVLGGFDASEKGCQIFFLFTSLYSAYDLYINWQALFSGIK